jgi:hypothetical protein
MNVRSFRQNNEFRSSLKAFVESDAGVAFVRALESLDPADQHAVMPVEQQIASAPMLVAESAFFRVMMDRLVSMMEPLTKSDPRPTGYSEDDDAR